MKIRHPFFFVILRLFYFYPSRLLNRHWSSFITGVALTGVVGANFAVFHTLVMEDPRAFARPKVTEDEVRLVKFVEDILAA